MSELSTCLELPDAPVLAIAKAIEAIGGSVSESPDVIIAKREGSG